MSEPGEEVLDVDAEDRKEADVTLNRFFQNVEREANKTVRFNVDQDEYEDRIDDYHWARFAGGYKDNNYLRIINEIERRGLNTSKNRDFSDYLDTDECERVMEGNDITVHVESGEYLVGELETTESLYDFLHYKLMKTGRTVLRYSGSLKSFTKDYMQSALGTEEKWLLYSDVFVYSKYLIANHNSGYLVMRGQEPIYCRLSRATEDDVMLKSMNENNWHDFLDNAIERALTNNRSVQNEFVDNIFENLNICFPDYKLMFEDVAVNYYQLLLTSSIILSINFVYSSKYCLLYVDLFTSKVCTYGMKKKSQLANKLGKFYLEISRKKKDIGCVFRLIRNSIRTKSRLSIKNTMWSIIIQSSMKDTL